MKRRNLLKNLLLIASSTAISLLIVFIAGEMYFRLSFDASNSGPPSSWYEFHETRGTALTPGEYSYVDIAAFRDVEVYINQFGLRHPDLSLKIPANKKRITVLGDSFVFGAALNESETLTAQLKARAGPNYEVVPIAVPGYGTGQQILFLQELQEQGYEIGDHLVVVFFTNDVLDNVGLGYGDLRRVEIQPAFSVSDEGELQHSRPPAPDQSRKSDASGNADSLASESLFLRYLVYQGEILAAMYSNILDVANLVGVTPRIDRRPGIITAWYTDGWDERLAVTEQLIEWLAVQYGQSEERQLAFAFIPSPFQVGSTHRKILAGQQADNPEVAEFLNDIDRPQRSLREASERFGIPFVDTGIAIKNRKGNYPAYFPREGHLNERGAAIVGDAIYEVLFSENPEDR